MAVCSSVNCCILYLFFFLLLLNISSAQLSSNFYVTTCPKALSTIRNVVSNAVAKEHRMGASLLRLHFYDCFVNANSLRGFDVIDNVKSRLQKICPGVVSCSDVVAVAARDSVVALGGPTWAVQLGRRDSPTASLDDAGNNANIPSPAMDLSDILTVFANKSFTAKEMVGLLRSHTIGQARCLTFRNRVYNETLIDASFATTPKTNCPVTLGDDNLAALDATTPISFDNGYFKNLVNNKGLLHSDQQLFSGGSTDSHVNTYQTNFVDFLPRFCQCHCQIGKSEPACWKE
ncbi:hypothetical protein ACH5RR_020570 [Cinchona calisaya]|uniref:Peroxidase n=1 Tax=Cinchona calisaya TaxID=153742 RepID=A0ABD2ZEW3_9GENT